MYMFHSTLREPVIYVALTTATMAVMEGHAMADDGHLLKILKGTKYHQLKMGNLKPTILIHYHHSIHPFHDFNP